MEDQVIEERRNGLLLSTDRRRLDLERVHAMLRSSHWASTMTREQLARAIANSAVGIYDRDRQIGRTAASTYMEFRKPS